MLLISLVRCSCAGCFAKTALCNPELVTNFLLDPVRACKDEFLFDGTHVESALRQQGDPVIKPARLPMSILFSKIYRILEPAVQDNAWNGVRRAALEFLTDFAKESVTPHVRIAPVRTMLAAAFFFVLMAVDRTSCPCSIVVTNQTPPAVFDPNFGEMTEHVQTVTFEDDHERLPALAE